MRHRALVRPIDSPHTLDVVFRLGKIKMEVRAYVEEPMSTIRLAPGRVGWSRRASNEFGGRLTLFVGFVLGPHYRYYP